MRGLIEGTYAMGVGGLVGARLAWLLSGMASTAAVKQRFPGIPLVRADFVLLGLVLLWSYLIYAAW
jgi:hypothetical protein